MRQRGRDIQEILGAHPAMVGSFESKLFYLFYPVMSNDSEYQWDHTHPVLVLQIEALWHNM